MAVGIKEHLKGLREIFFVCADDCECDLCDRLTAHLAAVEGWVSQQQNWRQDYETGVRLEGTLCGKIAVQEKEIARLRELLDAEIYTNETNGVLTGRAVGKLRNENQTLTSALEEARRLIGRADYALGIGHGYKPELKQAFHEWVAKADAHLSRKGDNNES